MRWFQCHLHSAKQKDTKLVNSMHNTSQLSYATSSLFFPSKELQEEGKEVLRILLLYTSLLCTQLLGYESVLVSLLCTPLLGYESVLVRLLCTQL